MGLTINELPQNKALTGAEQIEIDTNGVSQKTSIDDIVKFSGVENKQEKEPGKGLSSNDYTDKDKAVVDRLAEFNPFDISYLVTHSELLALRDEGELIPGAFYRITDFMTQTIQSDTRSAGHPFDIIVQALDSRTLSEDAKALQHEGDTYFANSNLKAWRLKYSLDCDTSRFAWAQPPARPQSWSCAWGVLESKDNNDASSNYEQATIDGKPKYLYRPSEPTSHLEGKQFYRDVVVASISSPDGFIYEADSAPSYDEEYGYDFPYEIRVKTASGKQVALLVHDSEGTYYDENDYNNMMVYPISFNDSYTEEDSVFCLTPNSGIEDWWESYIGGSIDETEREYYDGDVDSLYYAFDSILPKSSKSVTEVTDKVHIYKSGSTIDTVTYRSYIAPEDGGKGVIYGMTDEYGNYCNYDFKNIQFKQGANWYYTFGATDNSISGASFDNIIDFTNEKKIVPTIFKNVAKWNRFHAVVTTSATFEGKVQAVSIDTSSGGFTTILANGDWFGGVIDGNTKGSLTTDKLTSFRIQNSEDSTFKGTFLTCSFFGKGSVSIGDVNGNPKSLRGLRAYFGINDSNVKLVYNGTMSSTTGIQNIELVAPNWGTSEVTVNLDSYKEGVKIAKNSLGVVKVWNEADLA